MRADTASTIKASMPNDRDTLLAEAPSMGLQESQSRLWENHVGRSRAFWDHVFPSLQRLFPDAVRGLDAESFYRSVNAVRPGLIRVAADEISYHLHIVLRYELEVALISGSLGIRDLPEAWNERSASLIGATPTSDREGVLQDVHWSLGMFGYFPTYTLGSLYAAQLAETYAREHPLEDEIRRGEFGGLLAWLRTNIHRVGQRSPAEEIIENATGKGLDTAPFSATSKRSACPSDFRQAPGRPIQDRPLPIRAPMSLPFLRAAAETASRPSMSLAHRQFDIFNAVLLRTRYAPKTNGVERHAVAFADLVADNRDIEVTPATYEIPISAPVLPSRKHMRQRANDLSRKAA